MQEQVDSGSDKYCQGKPEEQAPVSLYFNPQYS
jgi:hypothetical protein